MSLPYVDMIPVVHWKFNIFCPTNFSPKPRSWSSGKEETYHSAPKVRLLEVRESHLAEAGNFQICLGLVGTSQRVETKYSQPLKDVQYS